MNRGWAGVARFGGVGDNLVAASVCRPLKKLGYNVEFITAVKMSHSVLLNNPFIDKLTLKTDGDIPGGSEWQKWFVLRAKEYDHFVHLSHSMEVRHALFEDSTPFWWPEDVRRKICAGSYIETAHDIAQVPYDFGPLFFPTEEELQQAQTIKAKVGPKMLGWVLSGTRIDKAYPYAPQIIPRIVKELDIPVVLMGVGPKQKEMADIVLDAVKSTNSGRDMVHVAVPEHAAENSGAEQWGIRPSLALALQSDLVVTPDTGIGWACAFESMPKIALVSHATPENITKHWVNTTTLHADPYRVPCWPCHRLHNSPDTCRPAKNVVAAACMADISVETLLAAIKAKLKPNNVVPIREAAE